MSALLKIQHWLLCEFFFSSRNFNLHQPRYNLTSIYINYRYNLNMSTTKPSTAWVVSICLRAVCMFCILKTSRCRWMEKGTSSCSTTRLRHLITRLEFAFCTMQESILGLCMWKHYRASDIQTNIAMSRFEKDDDVPLPIAPYEERWGYTLGEGVRIVVKVCRKNY